MGAGVKGTVLSELTKIALQIYSYFFEVSDLQAQTLTDATVVMGIRMLLCVVELMRAYRDNYERVWDGLK